MDSIALAYTLRPRVALTIDYGQLPFEAEARAATAVCAALGIAHETVRARCHELGSGDLAGTSPLEIAPVREWWPFRNQFLVTVAAMRGVALGVTQLVIGTVQGDSQHLDGTEEFVRRLDELLACQEGKMRVVAPAIGVRSADLVRSSRVPEEILCWAHSCHVSNFACGRCRGCNKHFETMKELGLGAY